MRKLIQIITAAVFGIGLMAGVAVADTVTCGSISNTGPGSTNTITCTASNNVSVTCDNNFVVANTNNGTAGSGNASSSGNTSGGFTTSGNATSSNSATVTLGASCAPVATVTATTPSAPTSAVAGGQGAVSVAPTPVKAVAPQSLPETGTDTAQQVAIGGLVTLGGTLAASQVGLRVYRRLALR